MFSHKKLALLFFSSGSFATGYWVDYSTEDILYTALINKGVTFKPGCFLELLLQSYRQTYQICIGKAATPRGFILTTYVYARRLQSFSTSFLLEISDFMNYTI